MRLPDGLPAVKVDGTAMTQVLLNLLDNAWKYSGSEGSEGVNSYSIQFFTRDLFRFPSNGFGYDARIGIRRLVEAKKDHNL